VCDISLIIQSRVITQRICTGQCPYCCDLCNKAFSQYNSDIAYQHINIVKIKIHVKFIKVIVKRSNLIFPSIYAELE
jgi:hypothetical protein